MTDNPGAMRKPELSYIGRSRSARHEVPQKSRCRKCGCCADHSRDTPSTEITWTRSRRLAPMERVPWLRFDTDAIVHGSANPLLAAKIAFGCLHGNVTEKKLDLIQLSARCMAQLRARTPQIM